MMDMFMKISLGYTVTSSVISYLLIFSENKTIKQNKLSKGSSQLWKKKTEKEKRIVSKKKISA